MRLGLIKGIISGILLVQASLLLALNEKESLLVKHVENAYNKAEALQSKLTPEILEISGMSGDKVRHFLNNLCALPETTYLEIGSWKGSTLISALYENNDSVQSAIAVDNWSQFDGPREEFFTNVLQFVPQMPLTVYELDSFSLPINQIFSRPINIYFYDGDHDPYSQERAFTFYDAILEDVFIAVVDDWNWEYVRRGTMTAFQKLNYHVLYQKEIHTDRNGDEKGWWNGLYVAVIKKSHAQ